MKFDPKTVTSFHFKSYHFNRSTGEARFEYAFNTGETFIEILIFPCNFWCQTPKVALLDHCLKFLHLMLGISYFKAAVPQKIIIENFKISKEQADFYNKIYEKGLGEFAYRNGLDLCGKIHFPYSSTIKATPAVLKLERCTAIPLGGGKDSIVTMGTLQKAEEPLKLITLGAFAVTKKVAQKAGLKHMVIERQISPKLLELNQQGALNGHVPISAIIAFILPIAGILYGFDTAALSNERSANVGNLIQNDEEINHQYSKSFEFERDVSNFIKKHVLSTFRYFSFLRPLSDLCIAKLFSRFSDYHPLFTSCNSAFKLEEGRRVERWCLNCPKCRFTFLALAPFLKKSKMIEIFGKNLLDDPSQKKGYDLLIGIEGFKPFECVGEIEESQAAFMLLTQNPEWSHDLLVKQFKEKVLPHIKNPSKLVDDAFKLSNEHLLPERFLEILQNAHQRS